MKTWKELHSECTRLVGVALELQRSGDLDKAKSLLKEAAQYELQALGTLDPDSKPTTYGATAVSVVSLWFQAGDIDTALTHCRTLLREGRVPRGSIGELESLEQQLLQTQHSSSAKAIADQATAPAMGRNQRQSNSPSIPTTILEANSDDTNQGESSFQDNYLATLYRQVALGRSSQVVFHRQTVSYGKDGKKRVVYVKKFRRPVIALPKYSPDQSFGSAERFVMHFKRAAIVFLTDRSYAVIESGRVRRSLQAFRARKFLEMARKYLHKALMQESELQERIAFGLHGDYRIQKAIDLAVILSGSKTKIIQVRGEHAVFSKGNVVKPPGVQT